MIWVGYYCTQESVQGDFCTVWTTVVEFRLFSNETDWQSVTRVPCFLSGTITKLWEEFPYRVIWKHHLSDRTCTAKSRQTCINIKIYTYIEPECNYRKLSLIEILWIKYNHCKKVEIPVKVVILMWVESGSNGVLDTRCEGEFLYLHVVCWSVLEAEDDRALKKASYYCCMPTTLFVTPIWISRFIYFFNKQYSDVCALSSYNVRIKRDKVNALHSMRTFLYPMAIETATLACF